MNWNDIKKRGEVHHKGGVIEPIDLAKANGTLQDGAIFNIIKYANRNRRELYKPISIKDMEKIKHYADMLIVLENERSKGGD